MKHPIIGQQAIVGIGGTRRELGIVLGWKDAFPFQSITVETRSGGAKDYSPDNVELVTILVEP